MVATQDRVSGPSTGLKVQQDTSSEAGRTPHGGLHDQNGTASNQKIKERAEATNVTDSYAQALPFTTPQRPLNPQVSQNTPESSRLSEIQSYSYRPLLAAKLEIRILVLQPGSRNDHIACKSIHFATNRKISPASNFKALSYTWGDPADTGTIFLNGVEVSVRKNLWLALLHIRSPTRDLRLWVDAISINQNNIQEKNEQVTRMATIYSLASEVLVWLGPEENNSDLAFKFMTAGSCKEPALLNDAMLSLANRDYWKRIWIIQEVVQARQIVLHCGNSTMSWDAFSTFFTDLLPGSTKPRQHIRQHLSALTVAILMKSFPSRLIYHRTSPMRSLETLLVAHKDSLSTNPLDKIYALLGLANGRLKYPKEHSHSIFKMHLYLSDLLLYTRVPQPPELLISRSSHSPPTELLKSPNSAHHDHDGPFPTVDYSLSTVELFHKMVLLFGYYIERLGASSVGERYFYPQHIELLQRSLGLNPKIYEEQVALLPPFVQYLSCISQSNSSVESLGPKWPNIVKGKTDAILAWYDSEVKQYTQSLDPNTNDHSWKLTSLQYFLETLEADNYGRIHSKIKGISRNSISESDSQSECQIFITTTGEIGIGPHNLQVNDRIWSFERCDSIMLFSRDVHEGGLDEGETPDIQGRVLLFPEFEITRIPVDNPPDSDVELFQNQSNVSLSSVITLYMSDWQALTW